MNLDKYEECFDAWGAALVSFVIIGVITFVGWSSNVDAVVVTTEECIQGVQQDYIAEVAVFDIELYGDPDEEDDDGLYGERHDLQIQLIEAQQNNDGEAITAALNAITATDVDIEQAEINRDKADYAVQALDAAMGQCCN